MGAAENIPEVLLKLEQVEAQTGMKKSYIYREMSKGNFPTALKIGAGSRWCQSEVQKWILGKKEAGTSRSEDCQASNLSQETHAQVLA